MPGRSSSVVVHTATDADPEKHTMSFALMFSRDLGESTRQTSADMSKAELRVLLYVISELSYGNTVTSYVGGIAEDLRADRSTVSKALARLQALDLVSPSRDPRGGATTWRVNPDLAFRGGGKKRAIAGAKWYRGRPRRRGADNGLFGSALGECRADRADTV